MVKHEFISRLLSLFTYITSKDEYGSYYDAYSRILTNKIDFDKLWDLYSQNFGKYPPTASDLKEYAKLCIKEDFIKNEKKEINNTILAEKYGMIYEFGQEKSFEYSKKILENRGFNNVRYKF